MRLTPYMGLAALAALACPSICAVDNGADDPAAGGGGPAQPPAADPPAPPADAPKAKVAKGVHVVWAAPGHATYALGMVVRTDAETAEGLRAAGKARPAHEDEVKAHKGRIHDFG